MASVLVVEDEHSLRRSLALSLEREGHDVLSTGSAREAIEFGCSADLDVVVTDWMLRDRIHGLHVARALKLVHPSLATILITGFPSRELAAATKRGNIHRLLHKPFLLNELHDAVRELVRLDLAVGDESGIALLQIDREGEIRYASVRAREWLEPLQRHEGVPGTGWAEVFALDQQTLFREAAERWVDVAPLDGRAPVSLRSRAASDESQRFVVLCPADELGWQSDPRVGALVGDSGLHGRDDLGPLIAIERDSGVRRLLDSQLERLGSLCYHADDLDAAMRLLGAEPRTRSLVIDLETAGAELDGWVARAREVAPELWVIGAGSAGASGAPLLDAILAKPWRLVDLVRALDRKVARA